MSQNNAINLSRNFTINGGDLSFTCSSTTSLTLPTTGTVATIDQAQTVSAAQTFSANGAASVAGITISGTVYTSGTGTTNYPLVYINSGTAPTTLSTNGTIFGINGPSGFTGDLVSIFSNGGSPLFRISSSGGVNVGSTVTAQNLTTTGNVSTSYAGGASLSPIKLTGVLYAAGTGTTNFPQYFAQPSSGATAATTWSTAGTYFGVNAASGFTGNYFDYKLNGGSTSLAILNYQGNLTLAGTITSTGGMTAPNLRGGTLASGVGFNYTRYAKADATGSTFTIDATNGNLQTYTNHGAFTLAPPTADCTATVLVTNDGSAGTITTSGFTKVGGDSFTTTNGHKFMCTVVVINSISALQVMAMQ